MNPATSSTARITDSRSDENDEEMQALATKADGLADLAAQSLARVLQQQTGHRISSLTASSIRRLVQNIIDAAVATARYEDAAS
jgi:hypothetical protein